MTLKTISLTLREAQTANWVGGWPCVLSEGSLDFEGFDSREGRKTIDISIHIHRISVFQCSSRHPLQHLSARSMDFQVDNQKSVISSFY